MGLALWEYYNQTALNILHAKNAIAISFDTLVNDPASGIYSLADQLRTRGVEPASSPDSPLGIRPLVVRFWMTGCTEGPDSIGMQPFGDEEEARSCRLSRNSQSLRALA